MTDPAFRPAVRPSSPRSIAVIGASENPNKIGGRPLLYLSKFGYQGKVYPINPNRSEAQGFKAYPSLAALPETPEVAIIAVPGDLAVEAVEECAARGVKVALVMTSGLRRDGRPGGAARSSSAWSSAARAAGMRMIGPNSQGLANFGNGAVLSFSTMFIEAEPKDGPVGMVSQSGAMSVVPYGLLRARGHRRAPRPRHRQRLRTSPCPSWPRWSRRTRTCKLLLLYLETIRDPWNLAEAARIARERGLPIVALKSGRTPAGQQAAQSHTGALANEDRVVDAFLEQHGIWRARDVGELVQRGRAVPEGLEAEGAAPGGDQQLGRDLRDGGRRRHRRGHADGAARRRTPARGWRRSCRASPPPPTRSTSPPRC